MKMLIAFSIVVLVPVMLLAQSSNGLANGNGLADGTILVPDSSRENPSDVGRKLHTNHLIFLRGQARQAYLSGLTPADIRTAYKLNDPITGASLLGGAGTIAIVDAYHYERAYEDLSFFSTGGIYSSGFVGLSQLPKCGSGVTGACFKQVYADQSGHETTTVPPVNCGWNQEAALDIEWAHAMAPNASIVLVEAQSNSYADLFGAVTLAANLVTGSKGQVSMSWGGSEYAGETGWDGSFSVGNVVFIASSGDTGGKTIYPSVSPYVVAAGGTTLNMTGTRGSATYQSETGWSGSGGGTSAYELRPDYQIGIQNIVGGKRGVPDLSFDANPSTGVLVYGPTCSSTNPTDWMVFGGTSVSAPALAGIINSAAVSSGGSFAATTDVELHRVYELSCLPDAQHPTACRDITSGRAGKFSAVSGWDFVTGVGTPIALSGK